MKSRDIRVPVNLDAQMSSDQGRDVALILNASSRGLALRSASAPSRGDYVELRAGNEVIVARVVWANGDFFGVRTQSPIPPGMRPNAQNRDCATAGLHVTMNHAPSAAAHILEQSLARARSLQFAFLAALGLCAAVLAYQGTQEAMIGPLDAAQTALSTST